MAHPIKGIHAPLLCLSLALGFGLVPAVADDKPLRVRAAIEQKLSGHDDSVRSLCFVPKHNFLASADRIQNVIVWDLHSAKLVRRVKWEKLTSAITYDPANDHVVGFSITQCKDLEFTERGIALGQYQRGLHSDWQGQVAAFSSDGSMSAFGYTHMGRNLMGSRAIVDEEPTLIVRSGLKHLKISPTILAVTDKYVLDVMEFEHNGKSLAIGGTIHYTAGGETDRGFLMLTDVTKPTVSLLGDVLRFSEPVNCLAWSPDRRMLAVGIGVLEKKEHQPRHQNVIVLDVSDFKMMKFRGCSGAVLSLAFSNDSKSLFVAGEENDIHVFGGQGWREMTKLEGHKGFVRAIRVSPDGKYLASGGDDKTVILWRLRD